MLQCLLRGPAVPVEGGAMGVSRRLARASRCAAEECCADGGSPARAEGGEAAVVCGIGAGSVT